MRFWPGCGRLGTFLSEAHACAATAAPVSPRTDADDAVLSDSGVALRLSYCTFGIRPVRRRGVGECVGGTGRPPQRTDPAEDDAGVRRALDTGGAPQGARDRRGSVGSTRRPRGVDRVRVRGPTERIADRRRRRPSGDSAESSTSRRDRRGSPFRCRVPPLNVRAREPRRPSVQRDPSGPICHARNTGSASATMSESCVGADTEFRIRGSGNSGRPPSRLTGRGTRAPRRSRARAARAPHRGR